MPPSPQAGQIAIALATHEPDPGLLAAQLESIAAQSERGWSCVISDDCSSPQAFAAIEAAVAGDERFKLSRSERRRGFYVNFERALEMVPASASLIAFADQDDRWHPNKLEVLAAAIGSAQMVHADARIVDREGRLISSTYWTERRPEPGDLASLLFANSVTGAGAMFRRELLGPALPFPRVPGEPYHDHWLALVALARGEIAYVPEPLHDYVQHPGAVLGHMGRPAPVAGSRSERWRRAYMEDYLRVLGLARALEQRCGPLPDPRKRRALHRVLASERSPLGPAWLGLRLLRGCGRVTGGAERTMLAALAWRWGARLRGYSVGAPGSQR